MVALANDSNNDFGSNCRMTNLYVPFQPLLTDSGLQRFSFNLQECQASTGLKGIVHSYLQIHTPKPSAYPMIPDGTQALFVGQHGSMISGGIRQALELQLPAAGDYFGIRFQPGALRHLFNVDINEIGGGVVDSQFLPSAFIKHLHESLFDVADFRSRARICDQWLLQQLARQPLNTFDQALDCIYRACGNMNITQVLAKQVGISSRHLNRLFQQHTGLSTKSFAQTIRFQYACAQLFKQPANSLEVALKTGYFDQAHLLKECKVRLAQSPVPFFERFMSDFYNSDPV
jgi:AraC-like DNA-binding protein